MAMAKPPNMDKWVSKNPNSKPTKPHVEVIIPRSNLLTWYITDFPPEVVGSIADNLPWWCLVRLFCTGDQKLARKLLSEQGVRHISHTRDDYRYTSFPSLVSKFLGLKTITLQLEGPDHAPQNPEVRPDGLRALFSLPQNMQSLSLSWNPAFGQLPALFGTNSPFKTLQTLVLNQTRTLNQRTVSFVPGLLASLPSTLTRLSVTCIDVRWSGSLSQSAMNLPIGLEILQMSIHGEINVNGWLSRLIYLNTFHARFATLTSDESAPQPTFPRSLTDLRVNGMKPLTMSDSLPNGLVTFSWFSTVTNSFGSFPMSATTSIIDANAACAKSLRVYKTDVTVYTFLSSIALPPLLTVLHLNPTGFGFAAVQQVQSLEEMPWKSIATLTDLNLGPYTFASELFPKALPPNITKLAIKLSECLIATSSMESTRPKERLWFPPSLTHIISLSQAPSRQSPPDLGVFKWLPTREEFPGMLVFTIVSRALHTYARGPSGYISYSTDTEWTSTLEAFLEDVPELLESWWCPATRSFGPFHDIVLHEHPFSMLVSNDSSKCINWLSEHAPGLCSDFAFCERLRREEDPEDHHLIGHSEKKTSTQIALQKGLLDVYKWLTIYGFRSVPNVVHLALDRPWDPEFLKWVATHGADLDIPNHLGITPLTRTLISKTAPEIAKWEYLLSLGATQLSWDAILQKMLSTGNLEYLELIQKAFSGIKGVATFRHLRNAFSQSFISNTVAPATISILDAMVKSEILVISGPNVQEMAQSALEQVLLKTMPRSPDWYLSLFKWFVELGIDIKLTPYFGAYGTIVHYGAKSGHLALVEYLDSLGVNWDQLDTNEHSPLKIAEAAGFAEIAAYLRPKTTAKSIDWKPPQWDSTVLTATASWEAFEANTVVFGRKSVANKASAKSGVGEQTLATSSETPATINSTTKVTSNPTITTNEQTSTPKISAVRPTLPRPAAVPSMTLYSKPPSRFESEDDTGEDDERETPVAPKKTASHPKSGITAKRPLNAIFGLPKATSSTNGSDSSGPTQKTGLGDTGSNPTSAAPKKAPLLNIFKFGPAKASSSVTEVEKTKDQ